MPGNCLDGVVGGTLSDADALRAARAMYERDRAEMRRLFGDKTTVGTNLPAVGPGWEALPGNIQELWVGRAKACWAALTTS